MGTINRPVGVDYVKNLYVFLEAVTGTGIDNEFEINIPERMGLLIEGTKTHVRIYRYNGETGALSPGVVSTRECVAP